ncbi:MAG: hypothetical protein AAFU85_27170 [Planctomycetota bacterium]
MNEHPSYTTARELCRAIGITRPVYFVDIQSQYLTGDEVAFINSLGSTTAATGLCADLMLRDGALRYAWKGRGFCIVWKQSAYQLTERQVLGVVCHEAGHYFDYSRYPSRDEPNERKAKRARVKHRVHHGSRWVRATVHAYERARLLGYNVAADHLQLNHPSYAAGKVKAQRLIDAVEPEVHERAGEPVESILRSPMPKALAKFYGNSKPKKKTTATVSGTPNATHLMFCRGVLVRSYSGRVVIEGASKLSEKDREWMRKRFNPFGSTKVEFIG